MKSIVSLLNFKQNKDFRKVKKELWLCNMCGNKFDRSEAIVFAGYELSPCCQNDNITKGILNDSRPNKISKKR